MKLPSAVAGMKMEIALAVAGAAVGIYLIYKLFNTGSKVAGAIGDAAKATAAAAAPVVEKVNPFDQNNVAATTANAIYKTATGKSASDGSTLATWITDHTWVNNYDPNAN